MVNLRESALDDIVKGNFKERSEISQNFKEIFRSSNNWNKMNAQHKEVFEQLAVNLSELLTGNVNYSLTWQLCFDLCKLGSITQDSNSSVEDDLKNIVDNLAPVKMPKVS